MNQQKRLAFLAACFGMLVFGITIVTLGSVTPALKDKFSLDNYTAGTLFSILPIGLIIGSLIVGPVCDRYGYKWMMSASALGICIGFEGIANAVDLHILRLFVLVFGISGGCINGATNSIVVDISDEHKGPNLSILGIFFGVGALGMPLVLSRLVDRADPLTVLAFTGWVVLIFSVLYLFIPFPPSKHEKGASVPWKALFSPLLLILSFYLFFQSSMESIITNWTTTYVASKGIAEAKALVGLSIYMLGMIAMRLLSASIFRNTSQIMILCICLAQLVLGVVLIQQGQAESILYIGLFLAGAGLSAGFPVMLGYVGQYFAHISATAISFVFVIALTGNMLINYFTGLIIQQYGIGMLIPISYTCIGVMIVLFYFTIIRLRK